MIRPDKVIQASALGSFINYLTTTDDIIVTATSLANGATRNIAVSIPYSRGGTIADIYATRGTIRTLVSTGGRASASVVYDFKSTETVAFSVKYTSSAVEVTLSITNNTGGAITPNAQTITISVVQYDAPITSIG